MDNGGQQSVMQFDMVSATYGTAQASMALIVTALKALTNSKVPGYTVHAKFAEDNFILPGEVAQNENKASLTVSLAGGNKKANIKIPAPVIGMFAGTEGGAANRVNTLYAPLLTYINYFTLAGNKAYVSDGERVDILLSGKRIHAKSGLG